MNKIYNDQKYTRILKWGKLISITGGAQVIIQAIGLVSGIMVIRLLPTNEYALYTLANTMLGTMTVLADGGITTGVMSLGGKVWKDPQKLGTVFATGFQLRKKFAVGSLLIATPVLFYLLRHHGASWIMTILIIVSLIPAFLTSLSGTLLQVPIQLNQNITSLQKNQVEISTTRLLILCISLFSFPWAFVAVLSAGLPQAWGNLKLRKISYQYIDKNQEVDLNVQKQIMKFVYRLLPGAIYFCISGQITIWLISIFGSTSSIAKIGGLSRLAMVFSLFTVIFNTLILPRFARLGDNLKLITKNFLLIQLGLILLCLLLIMLINLFANEILHLLGSKYNGLTVEVLLIAVGSCLALINSCTNQLLSIKNMIIPPVMFIPLTISIQVVLMFVVELDQIIGVLLYGIYTTLAVYTMRLLYFFLKRKQLFTS